jgi:hypothetical protein
LLNYFSNLQHLGSCGNVGWMEIRGGATLSGTNLAGPISLLNYFGLHLHVKQ